ncbi:unnamed protein product [Amoebophrya sp. A120]|nr:unnamed protein product [Amoebophrya sp. A120]|eukprot:GSA120T00022962001.1
MTRCFDVCYAVVLLKEVYRWAADTPKFHFTDNVAGNSVDWALGAYISLVANGRGSSSSSAAVNPSDRESSSYWLPNLFAAALVSGFLLWLFRKMVWKTASGEDRTMGNSVNDMSQFSSKDIEAGWDDELRGLSSSGTKELPDLVGNTLVPNRSY